jgi:hypothetical protein
MALLDVTGGALLSRLYRSGGVTPLALGLLGFLGYRAYQKRERLADMFGGAMGGIGKIPAMLLARTDTKPKPARKTRSRRKVSASNGRARRRISAKKSAHGTPATVH